MKYRIVSQLGWGLNGLPKLDYCVEKRRFLGYWRGVAVCGNRDEAVDLVARLRRLDESMRKEKIKHRRSVMRRLSGRED